MHNAVIAIYVENKFGVLTRVSSLFMRRGFNIESLTVGETDDPNFSRITVTVTAAPDQQEQIVKQLSKLHNVKKVKLLNPENTMVRELMLIKVRTTAENRSELLAATEVYRAKIIDYAVDTVCVEITGDPRKIDAFIEIMKTLGIVEICRTGVVALERGGSTIL